MSCLRISRMCRVIFAFAAFTGGGALNLCPAQSGGQQESQEHVLISGKIVNHKGMAVTGMPVTVRAIIDGGEESVIGRTDNQGDFLFEVPQGDWHISMDDDELLSRGYSRGPVRAIDGSTQEYRLCLVPNRPCMGLRRTTRGEVFLGLSYDTPEAGGLKMRRAYSIQASTNLHDWFEIGTSSSLNSFMELHDPGVAGQRSRFYRAVLADSTSISVEEYYASLAELDEIMSGIAREGITLTSIKRLRHVQAVLKDILEAIIANGGTPPPGLLNEFERRLDEIDNKLADNPLLLTIAETPVEVEISEAMRVIAEEYRRLGLVALNDYDRLPGIDSADLIRHETLAQYLDARQVGVRTRIPVFQGLSPYGNFTLINALVLKYGDILLEDATDLDSDGIAEINYGIFRRMVNGTELAFREAMLLIEDHVAANPIPWNSISGSHVIGEQLEAVLEAISDLDDELRARVRALVESKTLEAVFKNQMLGEVNQEIRRIYAGNVDLLRARVRPPEIELDIIPGQSISFPASPATSRELADLINAVLSWNLSIRTHLMSFLEQLTVADRLRNDVRNMLLDKVNGYRDQQYVQGLYKRISDRMANLIRNDPVRFDVPGVGSVLVNRELDTFVSSLPRATTDLLRLPGIRQVLTEQDIEALHRTSDWNTLIRVSLTDPGTATSDWLSIYGLRIQLTDLLLRAFGEQVVCDGTVDSDAYFRALIMDDSLERLFDTAVGTVDLAMAHVADLNLDSTQGISCSEYQALSQILLDTRTAIEELMTPPLDGSNYRARSLVTAMLQTSFDRLVTQVDSLLQPGLVRVSIGGASIRADATLLRNLLDAVAKRASVIPPYNSPSRRHYARLNGITQEMLLGLRDPADQDLLRTICLGSRNRPATPALSSRPDELEIRFVLVPAILEFFAGNILSGGQVDVSLVEASLAQDVYLPVARGATVWGVYRQIVEAEVGDGLDALSVLDFTQWSGHAQAEQVIIATMRTLVQRVAPLIKDVSQSEISILERDTQRAGYRTAGSRPISMRDLWSLYDTRRNVRTLSLAMADGTALQVPLLQIKNIQAFPRGATYDQRLFVGLNDSDFEDTQAPSQRISYNTEGILEDDVFGAFNRDRLVINIVRRHYEQLEQIPALYRDSLFQDNAVVVEILRRLIKGVDLLHTQILADVRQMTDAAVRQIQDLKEVPMTIDAVRNIYDSVARFHGEVNEYLNQLTYSHEREDVLEMEEGVSEIYGDVVDEMINYLRANRPVIMIDGVEIEVPVQEITEGVLGLLNARFPGEDIGAHHFASLFGVCVEDLRSYNKLEDFLGIQIVALPRNSQYVEVLSKLSEIGMLELATDSIFKYADEIVDTAARTVDVARLLDLLTDEALAVAHAKAMAAELLNEAIDKLESVEKPNTLAGMENIASVFNQSKLDLVNSLNDVVSGFSEEMLDEVQTHLDELDLYRRLLAKRDALVVGLPISFETADGVEFSVNLSALESNVVNEIVELLATMEGEPLETVDLLAAMGGEPLVGVLGSDLDTLIDAFPGPSMLLPPRVMFDPKATPTRFDFHLLIARLIHRYGDLVVEDGSFSLEKFLFELGRTDLERATESFEELREQALSGLQSLVPANEEPVHLDQVLVVHDFLDDTRTRFLDALHKLFGDQEHLYGVIEMGNQSWAAVMDRYEELLFSRNITVALDGNDVTIDVQALQQLMQEEYEKGHSLLLDSYTEGGMTGWDYSRYRILFSYWPMGPWPVPMLGAACLHGNEADASTVYNSLYPFTLGELNSIPGINAADLAGLAVGSEDSVQLSLSLIDPRELLRGRLNMRVFAPGSSLQTIGLVDGDGTLTSAPDFRGMSFESPIPLIRSFLDLSDRDIRFRVIPQIIRDYAEKLLDADGEIDLEKLRNLLENWKTDES